MMDICKTFKPLIDNHLMTCLRSLLIWKTNFCKHFNFLAVLRRCFNMSAYGSFLMMPSSCEMHYNMILPAWNLKLGILQASSTFSCSSMLVSSFYWTHLQNLRTLSLSEFAICVSMDFCCCFWSNGFCLTKWPFSPIWYASSFSRIFPKPLLLVVSLEQSTFMWTNNLFSSCELGVWKCPLCLYLPAIICLNRLSGVWKLFPTKN